jgi:hypothetical protein
MLTFRPPDCGSNPNPYRTAAKVRASNSPCLADMERAQCAWHSFGMSFTATITIGDPSHPEPQEGLPVDRLPDAFVTPEDARRAAQEHIEQLRSRGLLSDFRRGWDRDPVITGTAKSGAAQLRKASSRCGISQMARGNCFLNSSSEPIRSFGRFGRSRSSTGSNPGCAAQSFGSGRPIKTRVWKSGVST